MSLDPWDYYPHNPVNHKELENKCSYCGEPCEKHFCSKSCQIAELND